MSVTLVFGRQGQVARELAALDGGDGRRFIFLGRAEFDLTEEGDIARVIDESGATSVINAAAYTAVDRAETEAAMAFRLNRDAPGAIARVCAARVVPFVHFSTDYVFDGEKPDPYVETDARRPLGVYGLSKAEGEDSVVEAGGRFAILRTAWVFSAFGANFLKTILRLAETRTELGIVSDQFGRPTWARDLALGALAALDWMEAEDVGLGMVHASGAKDATWADFADTIFAERRLRGERYVDVRRIETKDYPTAARRPRNSRLCSDRAERMIGWRPTPVAESVRSVLAELELIS